MAVTRRDLLPLCSLQKITTRDGYTGQNANLNLPLIPYLWYPDGRQVSFPNALIAQPLGMSMSGRWKPDTYRKSCCDCA